MVYYMKKNSLMEDKRKDNAHREHESRKAHPTSELILE